MHYVAHPGLRKAMEIFCCANGDVEAWITEGQEPGAAQGAGAIQREDEIASGTSNPGGRTEFGPRLSYTMESLNPYEGQYISGLAW